MCEDSSMLGIVWYKSLAYIQAPLPKTVRGLHGSCCTLDHKRCTAKAAGVIAEGTEIRQTQWNERWLGSPNQVWAVMGHERPESAERLYSTQKALDKFKAHYLMTSMLDSDFPIEGNPPSDLINTYSPMCKNETRPGDVFYLTSNCATGSDRDSFVRILMKHMKIDSLGECLRNAPFPKALGNIDIDPKTGKSYRAIWGDWGKGLRALLCYYRFQVILTNAICDDYMDEKLALAFQYGVIPIYLGMSNVDDYDPGLLRGVHRAIISVLDFNDFEELAAHVNHLLKNESALNEYFQFRTVPVSEVSRVPRRELVRKDLQEYFKKNSSIRGPVEVAWFCDRVFNGSQPQATKTKLCYQTWHSFLKTKGKHGFVAALSSP